MPVLASSTQSRRYSIGVRCTGSPRRVTTQVVEAVDLAWLDADTLAVLGSTGETPRDLLEVRLGSSRMRTTVTPGSDVVTVAAAPDRPVLLGNEATTWRSTAPSWTVVPNASDAVYPG